MKKKIAIFLCCAVFFTGVSRALFAAPKPSIDGRAVVAEPNVLPKGAYGKSIGYLPGDSVTVTNPAAGVSIDVMILGVIDSTEGIAILLSPEAAESLFITKDSQTLVTVTKKGMMTDMPETAADTNTRTPKADPDKNALKAIPDGIAQKFERPASSPPPAEQPFPVVPPAAEPRAEPKKTEPAAAPAAAGEPRAPELGENYDWVWLADPAIAKTEPEDAKRETPAKDEPEEKTAAVEPVPEMPASAQPQPESPAPAEPAPEKTAVAENTAPKKDPAAESAAPDGSVTQAKGEALAESSPPPKNTVPAEISEPAKNDAIAESGPPPKNTAPAEISEPPKTDAAAESSPPPKNDAAAENGAPPKGDAVAENNTPPKTGAPAESKPEGGLPPESIVLVPSGPKPPASGSQKPPAVPQEEPSAPITLNPQPAAPKPPATPGAGANPPASEKTPPAGTFAAPSQVKRIQSLERGKYYVQIATFSSAESVLAVAMQYGEKYPLVQMVNDTAKSAQVLVGPLTADEYGAVLAHFKEYGYKDAFLRAGGK